MANENDTVKSSAWERAGNDSFPPVYRYPDSVTGNCIAAPKSPSEAQTGHFRHETSRRSKCSELFMSFNPPQNLAVIRTATKSHPRESLKLMSLLFCDRTQHLLQLIVSKTHQFVNLTKFQGIGTIPPIFLTYDEIYDVLRLKENNDTRQRLRGDFEVLLSIHFKTTDRETGERGGFNLFERYIDSPNDKAVRFWLTHAAVISFSQRHSLTFIPPELLGIQDKYTRPLALFLCQHMERVRENIPEKPTFLRVETVLEKTGLMLKPSYKKRPGKALEYLKRILDDQDLNKYFEFKLFDRDKKPINLETAGAQPKTFLNSGNFVQISIKPNTKKDV